MIALEDVFKYLGAEFTRPVTEGMRLKKAKFVMGIFEEAKTDKSISVMSLCRQSSDVDGAPHVIHVTVNREVATNLEYTITSCSCSCKAGSNRCKHVAAVLLIMVETEVDELEKLTCTIDKQKWGKGSNKSIIEPCPIEEFCHVKARKRCCGEIKDLPEEGKKKLRTFLFENFYKGGPLAAAFAGYPTSRPK